MSEEPHEEQVEDQHPVPLTQTFGYGAGTFLTVGVIDLLAHWGPTGLVIGGIAAYVVARHGPELTSQVREALPSPPAGQPEIEEPRQHGKRSFMDPRGGQSGTRAQRSRRTRHGRLYRQGPSPGARPGTTIPPRRGSRLARGHLRLWLQG